LDDCAIYSVGRLNNTFMSKVMPYHVIEKTVHSRLGWQWATERSQLDKKTWKQRVKSRYIGSTFDGCAFYTGGRWSNTSSSKVMPYHEKDTTVRCRLDWHTHTARSQLDNKETRWNHDPFGPFCNETVENSAVVHGATISVAK
jgi:hypothetical protein